MDLDWLREQFDPRQSQSPLMMQYAPFILMLGLNSLPKLTPKDHAEACEIAFTLFTSAVQGLMSERFINTYIHAGLEAPAMKEQFDVICKRIITYQHRAVTFIDRLREMPGPEVKKN